MRDVTERKRLEQELTAMAMKDGLTGLSNRRAFDEALATAWFRTVKDDTQMSLLLLDIDRFKGFNDAYGHQTGDDCLRTIARTLQSLPLNPDDMVARYGGEEIAIILAHAGAQAAADIASQACRRVEALGLPHRLCTENGGLVTVSVGVATAMACHGGSAEMPYALLAAADRALYAAKDGGRNRVATSLLLAASAAPSA
jgi:diguanylate cyclase (GGDEF)-like protein